ncbi:hypothetical protein LNP24_13705 [Klebsiella pneumoniae subsp. pneumoniae]|nr:hypothetical protein [Klebsiella pneumoniae subsp. pneumoniae]
MLWLNVPAVENDWFNELFRYLNAFDNLNEAYHHVITASQHQNGSGQLKSRKASPGWLLRDFSFLTGT